MKSNARLPATLLVALIWIFAVQVTDAADLNSTQRKELTSIKRQASKAGPHIRRKKFDEADQLLNEVENRLKKFTEDTGLKPDDRHISDVQKIIDRQRQLLSARKFPQKKKGQGGVSFENNVATLLKDQCLGCHAGDARGGLRLDTFAGLRKGGQSGQPLLIPGQAQRSLIIARLTAPAAKRMPKDNPALSPEQIRLIADWINRGAKFDGKDESAAIGSSIPENEERPVEIVRATGNETVSFSRHIAPFMANLCVRCHSGPKPRSGFSLETFTKLMRGTEDEPVVVAGNLEESRMWDLVGKQDPIKMPPGDSLITRTNWNHLKTWIAEGAKFDGQDANLPLRQLIPTPQQQRAEELARLTPDEFVKFRVKQSRELWKRVLPKEEPQLIESSNFLVLGNVTQSRLKQVSDRAEKQLRLLRRTFRVKDEPVWKGKLAVFVFVDRFGFAEFHYVVEKREIPEELFGHAQVTEGFADAYVVLQDTGETSTIDAPSLQLTLLSQLTAAYLQRSKTPLPEWLVHGTGLALAEREFRRDNYLAQARQSALKHVLFVKDPKKLFADGSFSPAGTAAVGMTIVDYLLSTGGTQPQFRRFIGELQAGTTLPKALAIVYNSNEANLAKSYIDDLLLKSLIND